MVQVIEDSLAETLDTINSATFFGETIDAKTKSTVGEWIAGRFGAPRSYRGLFAPTATDEAKGFRLFTGEHLDSRAQVRHILGEEAAHALAVLHLDSSQIREVRECAAELIAGFGIQAQGNGCFCCGPCSAAMLRHLCVAPLSDSVARIANGLSYLASCRIGNGTWKRFPFYYTLLMLSEAPVDLARGELNYVAPRCEQLVNRQSGPLGERRKVLLERILARS